jgi:hypothetical protein
MEAPEFNPDHIYRDVMAAGEDWADKKAAYEALDDNTKSVLADVVTSFMDGGKMSKAEAQTRAEASGDFKNHNAAKSTARRAWLMAQVKYDSVKMLAEMRRSQESTRRAEMRL